MKNLPVIATIFVFFAGFFVPHIASAHEVYVLTPTEIHSAIATPSPNPLSAIPSNEKLFLFWGLISIIGVLVVLTVSVSPFFEKIFDPFLVRLKRFAPFICRITLGASLFASGYYHALFGPELPLTDIFTHASTASAISTLLMVAGVCITLGILTRLFALVGIALYIYAVSVYHIYLLMYVNYLGELILSLIVGGGLWSLDSAVPVLRRIDKMGKTIKHHIEPYSFLILRVCFGVAIFSASFYAKYIHSNLALATVSDYHLSTYFPFSPLFLVLGAFIIEAILGICIAFGFELRFIALFLGFFLTQSLLFFGETVWPHIILFGVVIALFFHGYDTYTVEKALFQRGRKGEPVL